MAEIIDGRSIAQDIQKEIGVEIRQKGLEPSLVIILIGNDPASQLYINLKKILSALSLLLDFLLNSQKKA